MMGEILFLLVVFGYMAYYYFDIRGYSFKAVGWPYLLMAAAAVLGVSVIAEDLLRLKKGDYEKDAGSKQEELRSVLPLVLVVVLVVLYAMLLKKLGFLLCTFVLTFAISWFVNREHPVRSLITAVVLTGALYLVFGVGLSMKLPVGKIFR